ncbi:hypothetical protein [Nocardioides piscis]|uniref:DUF3558 domain-containing protein n=1 Tax=Nocardioides piscis TaxID=2714938 RepID=A0A6G7YBJ7_9ACTN|nr:hypothetical protein [Nocardioides piscis]QIK74099.1 hypothetical protein G7071_00240 [Nocardioides piscis]
MLITLRRPSRPPSRSWVAVGVACLVVLTGCSQDEPAPSPEAETTTITPTPTPLSDYATDDLALARADFCDRVGQESLVDALGREPSDAISWGPGDQLPGTEEVSNEFGCAWTASTVTTGPADARAWIFAPPITAERAEDFASEMVGTKCRRLESAPELGAPGVAQTCTLNTGAALTGFYGLVGDAWVGCEVHGTDEVSRVGEWCVAVLEAMRPA